MAAWPLDPHLSARQWPPALRSWATPDVMWNILLCIMLILLMETLTLSLSSSQPVPGGGTPELCVSLLGQHLLQTRKEPGDSPT